VNEYNLIPWLNHHRVKGSYRDLCRVPG